MAILDAFLATVVAAIWGFNFVAIDLGLQSRPPFLFSAFRFSLAAFPAPLLVKRGAMPWKVIFSIGIVLGSVKYSLPFIGMNLGMPAGLTSLVLQAQAIFTMALSTLMFRDKPTIFQWASVLISTSGLILIAMTQGGMFTMIGFLCIIGAALAWAIANIIIKNKKATVDNYQLMILISIVPPVSMPPMSSLFETSQPRAAAQILTIRGLGTVLYTSLLATTIAFSIWGNLLCKYSTHLVTPFALLVPVFGTLSAYVVPGEKLTMWDLAAMVLILTGLILITTMKNYRLRTSVSEVTSH